MALHPPIGDSEIDFSGMKRRASAKNTGAVHPPAKRARPTKIFGCFQLEIDTVVERRPRFGLKGLEIELPSSTIAEPFGEAVPSYSGPHILIRIVVTREKEDHDHFK